MTHRISTWVTRGAQELRALGPYAPYALAALQPGGSITAALGGSLVAALISVYRHSRGLHAPRASW
jgi:hypothetical protein